MIDRSNINALTDATVRGPSGEKIGSVKQVYLDTDTDQPAWATVGTGMLGGGQSLVPLTDARLEKGDLIVGFDKDKVKNAPEIGTGGEITTEEEAELYHYYGLPQHGGSSQSGRHAIRGRDEGSDTAMTRSEEQLRPGVERVQTGKARLRKHVVTEQQQVTVPVQREEARIDREPITNANREAAMRGAEITEGEHEVTLHAEKPVVDKETVPVERVRLNKETVREDETVSGKVRKEKIEFDDSDADTGTDPGTKRQSGKRR